MNEFDSQAYRKGYADYEAGVAYLNPYDNETQEHTDYTDGYTDAELDLNDC